MSDHPDNTLTNLARGNIVLFTLCVSYCQRRRQNCWEVQVWERVRQCIQFAFLSAVIDWVSMWGFLCMFWVLLMVDTVQCKIGIG